MISRDGDAFLTDRTSHQMDIHCYVIFSLWMLLHINHSQCHFICCCTPATLILISLSLLFIIKHICFLICTETLPLNKLSINIISPGLKLNVLIATQCATPSWKIWTKVCYWKRLKDIVWPSIGSWRPFRQGCHFAIIFWATLITTSDIISLFDKLFNSLCVICKLGKSFAYISLPDPHSSTIKSSNTISSVISWHLSNL